MGRVPYDQTIKEKKIPKLGLETDQICNVHASPKWMLVHYTLTQVWL